MATVKRSNHFPSIVSSSHIELQDNDSDTIATYGLDVSDVLGIAEDMVINGGHPIVAVVEVTENDCLECGETCIRTERVLVEFERVLSADEHDKRMLDNLKATLGETGFNTMISGNSELAKIQDRLNNA